MRKYNVKPTKGLWVDFPEDKEVKILIKPISVLSMTKLPSEDKITPQDAWDMFKNIIVDWKGLEDEDGKAMKCNEDNKKIIYEYDQELVSFVLEQSNNVREKVIGSEKELKNLKTSQPGEETKQDK